MDNMKRYLIYFLLIVGFFIFSEFLINVGLNSTYKQIEGSIENDAISIYQQEANRASGRIRGIIKKDKIGDGKYLKFDLYSKRNVLVGQKYIDINQEDNKTQNFELLFKANEVASYKANIVKEKQELEKELEIIPKDLNKAEIFAIVLFSYMIFW